MSKRKRFIITSVLLSIGFVGINLFITQNKIPSIIGLTIATVVLFTWSLKEGLGRNTTVLALVLPTLYTLGVGLFWFLLPATVYARLPIVALYGFGLYALCLTSNIFTVSAIRTIALVRAARGVGFVLTLLVAFLLYDAIVSLKIPVVPYVGMVFVTSIPLYLQGYWTSKLETEIVKNSIVKYTLTSSLVTAQIALLLFYWPVTVVVGSLFLTVAMYVFLGLGQASLEERLFQGVVREYLSVGLIVFITIFLATRWGG